MTWDELRKHENFLPATSAGWHQHPNGGGWVQDNCSVSNDSFIDENSTVRSSSTVIDSTVRGSSVTDSSVRGGSIVTNSTVRGSTVTAGARITGDHPRSPLWIQGTRYSIGYISPGVVASGCISKPLTWWLEHVERCAEEYGYTAKQQREYRLHIEHIAAWMRLYGVDRKEEVQQDATRKE